MTNSCPVVLRADGYNPGSAGPTGNQGQMMGGRGAAVGPEGSANMGASLMSENGAMVMYLEKYMKLFSVTTSSR